MTQEEAKRIAQAVFASDDPYEVHVVHEALVREFPEVDWLAILPDLWEAEGLDRRAGERLARQDPS